MSDMNLRLYGAGPAGLSAAVYGRLRRIETIVLERSPSAGKRKHIPDRQFLGFPMNKRMELATGQTAGSAFGCEIICYR